MKQASNLIQTEIGEIPEEWNLKQLQELAEFSNGYAFSSRSFTSKSDAAIAVFKMGNIDLGGGIRITGKEDYVDQNIASKLTNYLTQKDDILMCMTDMKSSMNLLGHSARITNEKFLVNQRVGRIRPKDNVNHAFLYYYLNSRSYIEKIRTTARSGVQVNLTTEAIKNSLIKYPPLVEQQQIASILSSLDDKIELNRRMNKTLEEIGKALFKRWFVDFEFPNENGKPYKSSGGGMVDSELGDIPKGWTINTFGQVVKKYIDNRGKTPPVTKDGIPLLEVKHLGTDELFPSLKTSKYVSESTYSTWFRSHLEPSDIIISTVGTIGLVNVTPRNTKLTIAQNVLGVRFNEILVHQDYMLFLMKSNYFSESVLARLVTTVQSSIKRKDLNTIPILIPDREIMYRFSKISHNIISIIESNWKQISDLAQVRDLILPRLISGRIRV